MTLGPVMADLNGTELLPEERGILLDPRVGGVLLFSRNYHSPEQVCALVEEIHALREPHLLVAVDHEGGRVQRFREGFTLLPAARRFGELYTQDAQQALKAAEECGWLMAAELRAVGVDFSFAPVLDLHKGISSVIGDRAFHRSAEVVARLARAFCKGMRAAGMAAVGKHFPGHGSIGADSHETTPLDRRRFEDIQAADLLAFERMVHYGLPAVMPAHVVYPEVDERPAGFSPIWLKRILRGQLGFQGTIFSDDLSMGGAALVGGHAERATAALEAGCDMLLVCNQPDSVPEVLDAVTGLADPVSQMRLVRMHGRKRIGFDALKGDKRWQQAVRLAEGLEAEPELPLGDDATA